jgi:hypothetical protein
VLVITSSLVVIVVYEGVAQLTEAEGSKEKCETPYARNRVVSIADEGVIGTTAMAAEDVVDDGVMGTTTMVVEGAAVAEHVGLNLMLAGTPGGVDRLSVVRPSRGSPEYEVNPL